MLKANFNVYSTEIVTILKTQDIIIMWNFSYKDITLCDTVDQWLH